MQSSITVASKSIRPRYVHEIRRLLAKNVEQEVYTYLNSLPDCLPKEDTSFDGPKGNKYYTIKVTFE